MFTWSIDSCMHNKNIQTLLLLRSHTFTVVLVVVLVITWHLVLSLIYLQSVVMHTQKGILAFHAIQVLKCASNYNLTITKLRRKFIPVALQLPIRAELMQTQCDLCKLSKGVTLQINKKYHTQNSQIVYV